MSRIQKRCPACAARLVIDIANDIASITTGELGLDPSKDNIETAVREVADLYGVSRKTLIGRGRSSYVVDARAALAIRLRDQLRLSTGAVGEIIGGRDHTTIMNLLRRHPRHHVPCPLRPTGTYSRQVGAKDVETLGTNKGADPDA